MALLCLLTAAVAVGGCRQAAPVIDNAPKPANALGTVSGKVKGPEGTSGVPARTVTLIDLESGRRRTMLTSETGGFTFEVPAGRYRLEVQLREGETILQAPDVIELGHGDIDANRDFVIGNSRVERPSGPAYRVDNGLGYPIA